MANSLDQCFLPGSGRIWYRIKIEFWTTLNARKQHWFGFIPYMDLHPFAEPDRQETGAGDVII
jgi:hypothetical protein